MSNAPSKSSNRFYGSGCFFPLRIARCMKCHCRHGEMGLEISIVALCADILICFSCVLAFFFYPFEGFTLKENFHNIIHIFEASISFSLPYISLVQAHGRYSNCGQRQQTFHERWWGWQCVLHLPMSGWDVVVVKHCFFSFGVGLPYGDLSAIQLANKHYAINILCMAVANKLLIM